MKNVFIIGSKGIPARYGGFETFVDKLTQNKKRDDLFYHVACLSENSDVFYYNNARCFNVKVPKLGPARAVIYDILALKNAEDYIIKNNVENAIIYILASRIGPFLNILTRRLKNAGVLIYLNPDGHEWKREKWNSAIRKYWKYSEKYMVKNSDLIICDSLAIERYINDEYSVYKPKTTYIAYGAELNKSTIKDEDNRLNDWFKKMDISDNGYYLIVGRFVPENNYETMIKEYMLSESLKDLVIITNVDNEKYLKKLSLSTGFHDDKRIKFVGTVYEQDLLKKIRENAYGYIHGHEVGGTNPSLLEALVSTKLNILLDVSFNKEVGADGALYFSKKTGNLGSLINEIDKLDRASIDEFDKKSTQIIKERFSWDFITNQYEKLFIS